MNSKKGVKKRVMLGILLMGIVIVSISFVSASWKDWFTFGEDKGGEGELAETATARVEVSPSTSPPDIIWVSSLGTNVGLSAGLPRNITFNFSASIDGVATGLPGAGEIAANGWNTYIRGNFSSIVSGEISPRNINGCRWLATDPVGNAYVNYSCNVTAWYYDTPFYNWTINVQMSSVAYPANFGPVNDSINFTYGVLSASIITPNSVNWTGLTTASKNSTSTSVTINNTGNVVILPNGTDVDPTAAAFKQNYIRINATILNGTWSPVPDTISPGNFTVSTGGSCNIPALNFTRNMYTNLSLSVTKYNPTTLGINTTSFCLKQLNFVVNVPQNFSTALSVPDLAWTINSDYLQ